MDPDTTYDLTVTTEWGDQYVRVWVDFNDDFVFSQDELIVDNVVIGPGQGSGTFSLTTPFVVPADAALGQHLMRAKTNWQAPVPNDACDETTFGETEDYTAQIGELGIDDSIFGANGLTVLSLENSMFDIAVETTNYTESLSLSVYNTLGQRLLFRKLENKDGKFSYKLDMGYVAKGVYLIHVGNKDTGRVKRIIVK
jgi:hypothetical protein